MARIEVRSSQPGIASVWVEVEGITDAEVQKIKKRMDLLLKTESEVSNAVAAALVDAATAHPNVNASDLWHHVIYRHFMDVGHSDNRWKRVSGFALERALAIVYKAPLKAIGAKMQLVKKAEAEATLAKLGLGSIPAAKIDLFLTTDDGRVSGVVHVKSSIAERIQDDVPASEACMKAGLLSVMMTMDMKSFPPPHGNGVNYGELGGRPGAANRDQPKREYVEVKGQFDALFSYNIRTPPSPPTTSSGKHIFTLPLIGPQPDAFVTFIDDWLLPFRK